MLNKTRFTSIENEALRLCSEIESWPFYYKRRRIEFESIYELLPKKEFRNTLEIGCGIGYQSAMLAAISKHVTATDIAEKNLPSSHTPGLKIAKKLNLSLKVENINFTVCSAEKLPFTDNSFDLLYSSHAIMYSKNLKESINEIKRVLTDDGIAIIILPTSMAVFYNVITFYPNLLIRITKRIFKSKTTLKINDEDHVTTNVNQSFLTRIFPQPHFLEFKNVAVEFKKWSASTWIKALGLHKGNKWVSTQVSPFTSLIGDISPKTGTNLHQLTRKIELKLGRFPFIKKFGINMVIFVTK